MDEVGRVGSGNTGADSTVDGSAAAGSAAAASAAPFYGWRIVTGIFVLLTVASGLTVYGLSVYLHAFVAEGRFPLELVSFASGCYSIAGGLVGSAVGRCIERYDIRVVMSAGSLVMAIAFLGVPWITTPIQLFLFYIVMGAGYGFCALVPSTTLVARWFVQQRTQAMSIAATGNSFGAIILVPGLAALVAAIGLDGASPWVALALLLGTLPLIWLVLKGQPSDLGLRPLGQTEAEAQSTPHTATEASYRAARSSRYFLALTAAFTVGMAAHTGGQTHLFNMMMQRGSGGAALASAVISTMAIASVLGRFAAIWVLERISTRAFAGLLFGIKAVALPICGLADSTAVILVAAAAYGATLGNFITVQSLLLLDAFGLADYPRLYGTLRVWTVPGILIGPGVMGLIYQGTGTYAAAFAFVGLLSLLGWLAIVAAGPTPTPTPTTPST